MKYFNPFYFKQKSMCQKIKSLKELLIERDNIYEQLEYLEDKIEVTRKREWSEKCNMSVGDTVHFISKGKKYVRGLLKSFTYNHLTDGWIIFVTPYLKSGNLGNRSIRVYPNEQETLLKYEK